MRFDDLYLSGVGSALPGTVTTSEAVSRGLYDAADREMSGMLGVLVAGETPAVDLAAEAGNIAVKRSGHEPDDFVALLHSGSYHQGPDGWSAPHYVLRNTIDRPITALEVRQGCLGMLSGLRIAAGLLKSEDDAGLPGAEDDAAPLKSNHAVLLTSGDNYGSPLVDRWRASRMFLLADGGAAVVASRRGGFAKVLAAGAVSNPAMEELHRGGETLFPPDLSRGLNFEERTAWWRARWAEGVAPPMGHLGELVAEVAFGTLEEAGSSIDRVKRVCHVGFTEGPLTAIYLDPLGVDAAKGTWELTRTTGHAGAGDPFIGLEWLWTRGDVEPGDHVLLIGTAPGMEAACAVVEITERSA
ncbi:ketoacyl-ACP synthase III family protein [Herbidospora daliensis]|uniref:ketoacyl-ACP synthase III family protein n=1 Tax=Herbidospora daliensis TaxID=295585 RepID=UPI0007849415|nr:ketoacyl-ACP synthase III family protein [Herbidospora daliensis]